MVICIAESTCSKQVRPAYPDNLTEVENNKIAHQITLEYFNQQIIENLNSDRPNYNVRGKGNINKMHHCSTASALQDKSLNPEITNQEILQRSQTRKYS